MMKRITQTTLMVLIAGLQLKAQWMPRADITITPFDGGYSFVIADAIYVGRGSELRKYNAVTDQWAMMTDFPGVGADRQWANAFVVNGKAYVGMGYAGGSFHTDLWQYDPVADSWTPETAFPGTARGGSGTFTIGNKGYICGGTSTGPTFSDVYSYDPATNVWTLESTLPTGTRGFPAAWAMGGYGYVYGGYVGTGNETAQLHRYDPATNTWSSRASFPGGGRQSAVAMVMGSQVVVGMGHSGFITGYTDFYSYNAATDVWSPMLIFSAWSGGQRITPVAAVVGNTAYLGAGAMLSTFTGMNDWWSRAGVVGIEEVEAEAGRLELMPNPVSDELRLGWGRQDKGHLTVHEVTGALVRDMGTASGTGAVLDVSGLSPGTYVVRYTSQDGTVRTGRMVKQ